MQASPPAKKMSRWAIAQVALLNVAVALAIFPLDSTLNRIMINELGLSATLVAFLIAIRFLTSPLRIWFGRLSDRVPFLGKQRSSYIGLGMIILLVGFLLAPHAAFQLPGLSAGSLLFAIFAFTLLGFGVNLTTPLYFAVVTDQSEELQRPRIVALMFILLGIAVVIAAIVVGAVLDPYTPERLLTIFYVMAGLIAVLAVVGLFRLERGQKEATAVDATTSLASIRSLLLDKPEVRRFFIYLVLTFIAIEAQEVILEPFAAVAFEMTPGETTRLTGIFRVGFLIMLALGAWLTNKFGHRFSSVLGIGLGIAGFGLIIAAGLGALSGPFYGGVLLIGLAAGSISVANLSLMMNMTLAEHAGVYLGAWGFAQGVGVGIGTLLGGVLRDVVLAVTSNQLLSYNVVYGLEILLLIAAVPFIWQLSVARFTEGQRPLPFDEAFAGASEA